MKCSSCGSDFLEGAAFKCPSCGKEKITRCNRCRKMSVKYKCKCGFVGP